MFEVQNLSKNFSDVKAVQNINFSITKGEIVGLLGPNGAGKTTTMRMLTGYHKPDSGVLKFDNVSLFDKNFSSSEFAENIQQAQKRIGYLPESFSGYAHMNVQEFLEFTAMARGLNKKQKQQGIDYAVTSVNLEKYFYRPIHQLSKGYRQRVGLAASLLHRPDFLILDEPTSGLDPNQIIEIQNLILSLAKEKTVILSTHILKEVEVVCKRAIIINEGKIILDKPLEQIQKMGKEQQNFQLLLRTFGNENEKQVQEIFMSFFQKDFNCMVENKFDKEDNIMQVSLSFSNEEKLSNDNFYIAERIFKFCVQNNFILLGLSQEKQSLQDVFHQLTLAKQ